MRSLVVQRFDWLWFEVGFRDVAVALRIQPVKERRARASDMEISCGAWSEPDLDHLSTVAFFDGVLIEEK